jgi:hypothetical protein
MKLYLWTIPKLLVMSWILSETLNNIQFHHLDLSQNINFSTILIVLALLFVELIHQISFKS